MRLAKCEKRRRRVETQQAAALADAVADINETRPVASALVVSKPNRGQTGLVFISRRKGRAEGDHSRRSMTFKQMLSVAFSPIVRLGDLSKMWCMDARWLCKIRMAVAQCYMQSLGMIMNVSMCVFSQLAPDVFVSSVAFDESTERLLLPVHARLGAAAQRSSWHVLVSQQHNSWVVRGPDRVKHSRWMNLARPPIPIVGTSSECLFSGLFQTGCIGAYWAFQQHCLSQASFPILHYDRDGASANAKLLARHFCELPSHWLLSSRACGNHTNNLVEGSLALSIDRDYINRMYSLSLLFRMHGYFSRLVLSLPALVESAQIRRGQPPPTAKAYSGEVQDYFICNQRRVMRGRTRYEVEHFRASDEEGEEMCPKEKRAHDTLAAAWGEFRAVFNGHWSEGPLHYCSGEACCKSPEASRQRMTAALQRIVFQALPTVPVKSKWLQTGPCVDWFMLAMAAMPLLQSMWPKAFGKESQKAKAAKRSDDSEEMGYQELAGKRLRVGQAFVESPSSPPILVIAGLVSEPLRFLTRWFLSRRSHANRSRPRHWQCCPLMDLMNPIVSPVVRVLQHLSCCIRGEAPRLRLLWGRAGFANFQQWARSPSSQEQLATLRRALTTAIAWTYARFMSAGATWPWLLASLADERISLAERRKLAVEFFQAPAEKLDKFFSLRLRARLRSAEDCFSEEVQDAIKHWAWSVRCSIADTEYVHGRNHRRAHPGQSWASFAASHISAEARLSHTEAQESQKAQAKAAQPSLLGTASRKRVRKKSAVDVFRSEWFAQQKAAGRPMNPTTCHREIKDAFESLPEYARKSYDVEAAVSLSAADDRPSIATGVRT